MVVSEIRMFVCDEPRLKATLSVTLDEVFVIKGVKIILGRSGLFVAMPSRRTDSGFEDICHPVRRDFRLYLERQVMEEYARKLGVPFEEIEPKIRREDRNEERSEDGEPPRPSRPQGDRAGDPGPHP